MGLRSFAKVGVLSMMMIVALGLTSCMKDDGGEYEELVAAVEALNAIPNSGGIILALDNNQLNNLQMGEYFLAGQLLNYRRVYPGNRLLRAFHPDGVENNQAVYRSDIYFEAGKYYSLFVVESAEKGVEVIQVTDELTAPAAGKALIRFINLNPNARGLDFGIVGQTGLLATNTAFKAHTVFMVQDADKEYEFFIKLSDSDQETFSFKWTPKSKDIYTVWTNGGLTYGIITH